MTEHTAENDAGQYPLASLTENEKEVRAFLYEQGRADLWLVIKAGFRRSHDLGAEALARAWWIQEVVEDGSELEWAERAWDDMGGSEPSQERAEYVARALFVLRRLCSIPPNIEGSA